MTEVLLKNHRGYSISINTETGEFLTDIGNDGTSKKSLKACEKAIDDYIKENRPFTPKKAYANQYMKDVVDIAALRVDGSLTVRTASSIGSVVKESDYKKSYATKYYSQESFEPFKEKIEQLRALNSQLDLIRAEINKLSKQITPVPMTWEELIS